MKENGYINATKICNDAKTKNGNKNEFKEWLKINNSKILIEEISSLVGIPSSELLIRIKSGSKNLTIIRGTYVHPLLITPIFAVKISIWIEEWKKYSHNNLLEYYTELSKLEVSINNNKEKIIQQELHKCYGGKTEVKCNNGIIDLLTNNMLIEIKDYYNWKCALGQLIAYSFDYPDKEKCMYLFNVNDQKINNIKKICKLNKIKLMIYN